MGALEQTTMELTLAAELVDGLAPDSSETRVESDRILVRLRKHGWKLTNLIFSKESLRRLAEDRHREIKMEYLEREIEQMAALRQTYAYPRRMSRCA